MTSADLRYLASYILPVAAFAAVYWRGSMSFVPILFGFVFVPAIEFLVPPKKENHSPEKESSRLADRFFDWLLYLNVPIIYGLIGFFLYQVSQSGTPEAMQWWELLGLSGSVGLVMAANGLNVAHELGHRVSWFERTLSKMLLLSCLFLQFHIDHNRGHHLHVGTPLDPSTARFGESLYQFWFRAIPGIVVSAFNIEGRRLAKVGLGPWTPQNALLRYFCYEVIYLLVVFWLVGWLGLVVAVAIAVQSILTIETIDYIEHYGLYRVETSPGKYERVQPKHSWNSNHLLGRTVLFELTRHSDHHAVASRPYQVLRHCEPSPELPFGYPSSMILAMVPPLWFRTMNPRLAQWTAAK